MLGDELLERPVELNSIQADLDQQLARLSQHSEPASGDLKPLNFKVPAEFHREFKTYAASHGISMLVLLQEGFEAVKRQRGV